MVKCAVSGCSNYEGKKSTGVRFFRFPKDLATEKNWIDACGKNAVVNVKAARMCSEHFKEDDWKLEHILLNIPEKKKRLREGVVPTRNLPYELKQSEREKRYQKKKRKQLVEEILSSYGKSQETETLETEVVIESIHTRKDEQDFEITCNNVEVQTEFDLECSRELEMYTLRGENIILKHQIRNLMKRLGAAETATKSINEIFTKGQIKRLTNPQQRCKWSNEDFSSAIALYTAGPRAYKILCKRNYPLPSAAALRKWACKLQLSPGILDNIVDLLSNCDYDENERICVMAFDQIELKACFDYKEVNDAVLMPFKSAQVVMIRGLLQKWKHIIYYDFNCAITASILTKIVRKLKEIDFKVVAIVSGMGQDRLILWKELQITEEKPYFVVENDKVFFFVDVPHIIKLIRHHFLDAGFVLNGKSIDVSPIRELIDLDKTDMKLCNKLTANHITIKKASRQKVKFSAQIFSNSVSEDLRKCVTLGKMYSENALECCDFFKLVNDWFDVFNSKSRTQDNCNAAMAYGLALEDQNKIISAMNDNIKILRVTGMESMRPFQKGILLNNSSLPKLFEYLHDKYNVTSIITNRLNQDELKKFLGVINIKSGLQDNTTPLEFKYRLRSAILSNLIN